MDLKLNFQLVLIFCQQFSAFVVSVRIWLTWRILFSPLFKFLVKMRQWKISHLQNSLTCSVYIHVYCQQMMCCKIARKLLISYQEIVFFLFRCIFFSFILRCILCMFAAENGIALSDWICFWTHKMGIFVFLHLVIRVCCKLCSK